MSSFSLSGSSIVSKFTSVRLLYFMCYLSPNIFFFLLLLYIFAHSVVMLVVYDNQTGVTHKRDI